MKRNESPSKPVSTSSSRRHQYRKVLTNSKRPVRGLAREAAGLPDFGFHDLRRFFASRAVMSGIDFLTVSRWFGHKDGGILLAKSYAHLANEHRKTQAARLVFAPVVIESTANAAGQ